MLYFGREQVFWECEKKDYSEDWPDGVRESLYGYATRTKPRGVWTNSWRQIVEGYSSCQLSIDRDKLVALSGIAQSLQKTGDEYLAGLWRSRIERELQWEVENFNNDIAKRSLTYRAPTWSWASLDGNIRIRYGRRHDRVCIQVLDAQIEPKPFGELSSGTLTIRSEYFLATTRKGDSWFLGGADVTPWIRHDDWAIWDCAEKPSNCFLLPTREIKEQIDNSHEDEENPSINGLILKRVKENDRHYARVGAFEMSVYSCKEQFYAIREAVDASKIISKFRADDQGNGGTMQESDGYLIHLV